MSAIGPIAKIEKIIGPTLLPAITPGAPSHQSLPLSRNPHLRFAESRVHHTSGADALRTNQRHDTRLGPWRRTLPLNMQKGLAAMITRDQPPIHTRFTCRSSLVLRSPWRGHPMRHVKTLVAAGVSVALLAASASSAEARWGHRGYYGRGGYYGHGGYRGGPGLVGGVIVGALTLATLPFAILGATASPELRPPSRAYYGPGYQPSPNEYGPPPSPYYRGYGPSTGYDQQYGPRPRYGHQNGY